MKSKINEKATQAAKNMRVDLGPKRQNKYIGKGQREVVRPGVFFFSLGCLLLLSFAVIFFAFSIANGTTDFGQWSSTARAIAAVVLCIHLIPSIAFSMTIASRIERIK